MIRNLSILFIIVALLLIGCLSNRKQNDHPNPFLIAWNEDTINSYQITLLENKTFAYSIVKRESGLKKVRSFVGTYQFSSDSILLNYKTKIKPEELAYYLIREASGSYVIQYFADNTKRMFLRSQKLNHRF